MQGQVLLRLRKQLEYITYRYKYRDWSINTLGHSPFGIYATAPRSQQQ